MPNSNRLLHALLWPPSCHLLYLCLPPMPLSPSQNRRPRSGNCALNSLKKAQFPLLAKLHLPRLEQLAGRLAWLSQTASSEASVDHTP